MIEDTAYMDLMKQCSSWNARVGKQRRNLLPFWDAQTNTGQKPGNLWRLPEERIPPRNADMVYSYPARRWRKRKRDIQLQGLPDFSAELMINPNMLTQIDQPNLRNYDDPGLDQSNISFRDHFKPESVFTELEDMSDSVDDFEDPSDGDDYEESYVKKKRTTQKKKTPGGLPYTMGKDGKKKYFGGAAAALIPPEEKPYCCRHCGARYKSKPGLNYHLAHVHSDFGGINQVNCEVNHTGNPVTVGVGNSPSVPVMTSQSQGNTPSFVRSNSKSEGGATPSLFCDFCLGDARDNKKTGQPEELISCHDCGRSGHPSCHVPKFTANMIISTKKYGWQCIECKSCAICGTSENDDQLLFCDDCDRGFHLYCLTPPLQSPPDGEWSCHLCQVEFGPTASAPGLQFRVSATTAIAGAAISAQDLMTPSISKESVLGIIKKEAALENDEEPKSVEQ